MNAVPPNAARSFHDAHAADYDTLKTMAEGLQAMRPQRGSDPGEVLHCLNGARQQLVSMDDGLAMGLCALSLGGYIDRLETREQGVPTHLRPSSVLRRLVAHMPKLV